ncbi:MAG: gliding motility-associated C-terminal domain-containing protein [Cyclobacteriaceae bacterium]|nr:gliding motility-associated C-terminal domain-containing protein [Cyclobacteriaceae bacterium]
MRYFFVFVLGLVLLKSAEATHLRAADIRIEPVCGSPRTFTITVVAYLNTQSNTRFGTSSEVIFGDGSSVRIPITIATLRPDLGLNIAVATFTVTHTYPSDGNFTVTYMERDRSSGILNIANSDDVPYVTFVNFTINPINGCNHVPFLSVPPLDRACFKSAFFHTPGAYDTDGDSLSYELSVPASSPTSFANYTPPNNPLFYTNFNSGNEKENGPPIFTINPISGLLTWDAPGRIGEYNIAFKIIEWRKDSTTHQYRKLSTTTRDMQIVVEECLNIRPELIIPADLCVEAGTSIKELIRGIDQDKDAVKIEVFSELIDFAPSKIPATYSPNPPSFSPSDPPAELRFQWQTDCLHVRQQPYQVVFKITDNPPKGPKLVNFKIWNIKVVAPAPQWVKTELDLVKRHTNLEWNSYACSNADKIQIWRKVDSYPYSPGLCSPGLPKFFGYNLIGEVPVSQTTFTDTNFGRGLVVGATYCYRILAYFNSPASTPSLVSLEKCIGPIEADAPVITHVSVEKTDADEGKIRVSWRSPFAINEVQFPKPYEYEIYRAIGFAGDTSLIKAGRVSDTTFLDAALNTEEKVFNYRIVLYAIPQNAQHMISVDTSAIASSVRLKASIGIKKIELAWRDSVPWSNVIPTTPYHLIYRSIESPDPQDMILIDSVNVTENGFTYVDLGKFNNEALQDDKRYSYRILTRGTYGNPKIKILENFSQVITTYPENKLLPCTQALELSVVTCDEYLNANNCSQTEFSNTLRWTLNDLPGCRRDIRSYNVYGSQNPDGEFELVAQGVKDTFFVHNGLPSFAYCYKVSAIDALGQEGPRSDYTCNDNCPYYMLPNVFTPNEDGFNDVFSANFDVDNNDNTGLTIRCPRFVKSVLLHVYNRWGSEVYQYRSQDGSDTSIHWDGTESNGHELATGVYYYRAEVIFDRLYPKDRHKEINGWVQLIR